MKKYYVENDTSNSNRSLYDFVCEVMASFFQQSFRGVFNHCGYSYRGFNPERALHTSWAESIGYESTAEELDLDLTG